MRTKTFLTAIALGVLISGCAIFDQAADKIADGVQVYCEQPYVYRSDFRNTINAQLGGTGHSVHVHCAGDPADDISSAPVSQFDVIQGATFTVVNIGAYDHATEKESYTETTRRTGEGAREIETHAGQKEGQGKT